MVPFLRSGPRSWTRMRPTTSSARAVLPSSASAFTGGSIGAAANGRPPVQHADQAEGRTADGAGAGDPDLLLRSHRLPVRAHRQPADLHVPRPAATYRRVPRVWHQASH